MKRIKKISIFYFLLLGLMIPQYAQEVSNVGKSAGAFLEIGAGARAIGMGGAFVATANDISAMYWNTAGISKLETIQAIFVHTNWLADINYNYAGIVFPMQSSGTIGINITTLSMGEMEVRTMDRPEGTGELFDASDLAMGLSYAMELTDHFSLGFNLKYISQRIWKETAQAFAVDIGTLYQIPIEGMRIGATISNFGTDMQMTGNDLLVYHDLNPNESGNNDHIFAELKTDSWPLPVSFQLGLAMDFIDDETNFLTAEIDGVHPIDNTESMHLGVEYGFKKMVFLRAGYRNLFLKDSEEGLTLGGGVNFNLVSNFGLSFNYAYADFGRLQNAHRFSAIVHF